ncbi:queuosine precursor transporter [Aurantiacibacter aquimixticola]|uniref:Probable queuosine precursor transporter n=1 Tax=Aurantiacibacter aquimixticola TaxID=1958945 RepID=A0A419RW44_9SPHN|nr:queuosine precursor transporter [Aurantiacibacter aquimixticola]RJY10015.1 VUT family protein [Aurantiacibacter aquimixticola]
MTDTASPASGTPISRSLFVYTLLYGGMTVIAGVLAFKQFAIGPLKVEAGILAFLLLVVMSSAISQIHGKAAADRLVLWGFLPLAFSIALIGFVLALPPSPDMPAENLLAFNTVHAQTPRIMAAGPVAYGVSLLLNVWIFDKLRGKGGGGGFWLMARGAIASAISQAIDTLIFITLAFYGEFPIGDLLIGQAIAKIVLSFVLVPFLIAGAVALAKRLDATPLRATA